MYFIVYEKCMYDVSNKKSYLGSYILALLILVITN